MSTAVSSHSGAGPLSLMSCVRESSPPQDAGNEYEPEKNVSTKKKFWNPRKWFKRKSNKVVEEVPNSLTEPNQTLRSRSTSELSVAEDQTRRRSGTPMHPGLSVSHDSVFHSPHSGSELELEAAQSSSSLSIGHHPTQSDIRLQTELEERLRKRRGDTSEDDEGLPHSPCNSPTTTEGLLEKSHNKDLPTKSHSTCSDGSLLSMGSSEMDEDSFDPHSHQSRHASKLSLQEKNKDVTDADMTECWGPTNSAFPLNHSAAHHKVSIRPKRTHAGAPKRKRTPVVLPTTPEVNEDSAIRGVTPEIISKDSLTEHYTSMSYHQSKLDAFADYKMKCSSLPPGLAGPGGLMDNSKLTRSRSNAGTHGQESFAEEDEYDQKNSTSFFGRIFPRRSAKKKKAREDKEKEKDKEKQKEAERYETSTTTASATITTSTMKIESSNTSVNYDAFDRGMIAVDNNLAIRPNALRTGPASRQRVQPIDIPVTPEFANRKEEMSDSPIHDELDEWFQKNSHMHTVSMSTSMTEASSPLSKSPLMFSMSPPKSPWTEKRRNKFIEHTTCSTTAESKSIVRIAGLSPLQQRVMSLNDDTDTGFKSLTNLPSDYQDVEKPKPVAKSHSFKTAKSNLIDLRISSVTSSGKSLEEKTSLFDQMESQEMEEKFSEKLFKQEIFEEKLKTNEEIDEIMEENNANAITISGPSHSHRAIVNIEGQRKSESTDAIDKKTREVSVTKVQLNRQSSISPQLHSPVYPLHSPVQHVPETRRKSSFDLELNDLNVELILPVRKFSNDNIEVIKKEDAEQQQQPLQQQTHETKEVARTNSIVTVTSMTNASHYRKNSYNNSERSEKREKPVIRTKSNSFDSVESKSSTPRSSQSSLDKMETKSQENIKMGDSVVRRRSLVKQRQDEEPELMKVFARRSLKLKDSDIEALQQQVSKFEKEKENKENEKDKEREKDKEIETSRSKGRDSDKENLSDSSPVEERKKPLIAPKTAALMDRDSKGKVKIDGIDVTLRKPIGNKIAAFQNQNRPVTVSPAINKNTKDVLKANVGLPTRPKTELKFNGHSENKDKTNEKDTNETITNTNIINTAEIISNISEKSGLIDDAHVEVQNFRLRKAEWEKRAQESIRKTTP